MSETNPEIQHWQSVVDDLRVANERVSEEVHRLRQIVGLAARYIAAIDKRTEVTPTQAFDDMHAAIETYFDSKGKLQ